MSLRAPVTLAVAAALIVGGGAMAGTAVSEGAPTATTAVVSRSAGQSEPARKKPSASLTATYEVLAGGSVRVDLVSNARAAQVKYRTQRDRKRTTNTRFVGRKARVTLAAGSHAIRARAKATARLAASRWVAVSSAAEPSDPTPGTPTTPGAADPSDPATPDSAQDLVTAARMKVFFGHQSVGQNILDAVPAAYRARRVPVPEIVYAPDVAEGGFISEIPIGENGDPRGKINAFAAMVRESMGDRVQVALMKLCYTDIDAGSDVAGVFARYRNTLSALQSEFPGVEFLHVTVPVTTGGAADNVARERFNRLMRQEYGATSHLFDLAAIESTTPSGSRVSGTLGGETYFTLFAGFAADEGHLNDTGARAAADGLLLAIAAAVR